MSKPTMKRHEREALYIIRGLVGQWDMPCRVEIGGKHRAIIVTAPDGGEHKFPISSSPKNVGDMLGNVRQQVMAWLERQGFDTGRGTTGRRKTYRRPRVRSTIYRVEVAINPDTGPARDPWAVLAGFRMNG